MKYTIMLIISLLSISCMAEEQQLKYGDCVRIHSDDPFYRPLRDAATYQIIDYLPHSEEYWLVPYYLDVRKNPRLKPVWAKKKEIIKIIECPEDF